MVEQYLRFVQQGVGIALKYIRIIWMWSIAQIESLPWESLGQLENWKLGVMAVVAIIIIYLLYSSIRELLEAGQKTLFALVTLLTVVIKTLLPLIMAGLVAAGGAWVINNINF
jgi:chromate transport protein ChrA